MAYEDLLKDDSVGFDNNSYFLVTITDLNISTSYPLQFRWKYDDGSYGVWSNSKTITTPGESFPNIPSTLTVVGGAGILTITWDGKDGSGNTLTNFDRLDIYIDGLPFDGTKSTASLYDAGVKTIVAPAGTYTVAAYAVSKAGTRSAINTPVTRTVTANVPTPASSVTPSAPTASSVLGAIQLSWDGKTSTGTDQPYGFNAAKVYVGTSSGFTPSSSNQVDTLNFANGQNTLNIAVGTIVNGTALDYGIDYYIKIATTNGTDTSTPVLANGSPAKIGQVTSGDIVTVTADKIATGTVSTQTITVGSPTGKHVTLSGTGDPFTIYDTNGTTKLLSYGSNKLTIVGDGTFTGNISGATGTLTNALTVGIASGGLYPFSVDSSGNLRAIAGTIGGWTLGGDYLSTTNFKISKGDAAIYVGDVNSTHLRISASGGIATYNGGTQVAGFNLSTSGTLTLSGTIAAGSGSTLGGWTSGSTYFYGGNMRLNSDGSITTGVGGSNGNFYVTSSGIIHAQSAVLSGEINATTGYIGTSANGWYIDDYGLTAQSALSSIDLGSAGVLSLGNYSMLASGSYLTFYETVSGRNILETDLSSANGRLILGYWDQPNNISRQVEVAKSAQIAGSTVNSLSGGLRNMYTIGSSYYTSSIYNSTAKTGDVLLVWE